MIDRRGFLRGVGLSGLAFGSGCLPFELLSLRAPTLALGPFAAPDADQVDLVTHVLRRCSFGIAPGERSALLARDPDPQRAVEGWLDDQLHGRVERGADDYLALRFPALQEPVGELYEYWREALRGELIQSSILHALFSPWQLREVLAEVWCDHFNVAVGKADCGWLLADQWRVIRWHALGSFGELLRAVTLGPAMLWYLDGRLNRWREGGGRPNENHARELLELHCLGVHGGYTQRDVMELARCLSGWTVVEQGSFERGQVVFRAADHDDGPKQLLGQSIPAGGGAGDAERALQLLLAHPSTARHVAAKLCRRFLADDPPPAAVDAVAARFAASDGDLVATLGALFARPEFRAEAAELRHLRSNRLKRPFHYVVSLLRATAARSDGGPPLQRYLQALGQLPFTYPTPEGPPDRADAWRDGLLWRWKFAEALAAGRVTGTRLNARALLQAAGGREQLAAHLLGRRPRAAERAWLGDDLALVRTLAHPDLQRY